MAKRSNDEWIQALKQPGEAQTRALQELREYLRRAVFVYLRDRRSEVQHLSTADLHELAEDFAQEALLSIKDNLHSFRGEAKFTTWAYRFVINEALAELRRWRYRHIPLDELVAEETAVLAILLAPDARLDPDLAAEREDFITLLMDIIDSDLNERQRLAILGVHFQGLSMSEVAEQLETSTNTVYKMLHDARKKIKARLTAHHLGAGDILALFEKLW